MQTGARVAGLCRFSHFWRAAGSNVDQTLAGSIACTRGYRAPRSLFRLPIRYNCACKLRSPRAPRARARPRDLSSHALVGMHRSRE